MNGSVGMEFITCLWCGSPETRPFVSAQDYEKPKGDLYHLEKCQRCGLVFQNPRPTAEELPNYYASDRYYSFSELEKKKKGKKKWAFESLRQYLFEKTMAYYYGGRRGPWNGTLAWIGRSRFGAAPKGIQPGRILDIGCGDGVFLDVVQRLGWETYGVELNTQAADRAREAGIQVHGGDLFSANYSPNFFDLVRLWSVLEHVPNPKALLAKIREILRPGGLLILQAPNIDSTAFKLFDHYWSGLDLPRHLTHFSPPTLRRVLAESGFQLLRLKFASVGTSLASLLFWKRLKESRYGGHPKYRWISERNPLLRLASISFDRICDFLGKGDCMYAWARKVSENHAATNENVTF